MAVVLLGLVLEPRRAAAAEPGNEVVGRLVYTRAGSAAVCPEERTVHDIFLAQLGRDLLTEEGRARLHLTITSRPGHSRSLEGHIELSGAEGRRVWANDLWASHDDCATLIASLALSFRVALSSLSGANQPPPRPKPRSPQEEPIVIEGVPVVSNGLDPRFSLGYGPVESEEAPASSSAPSYEVWGSGAGITGSAPGAAMRLGLGLGLSWGRLLMFFEPRVVLPAVGRVNTDTLRVTRFDAAFVPCYRYGLVFACGIVSAGGIWAESAGPANDLYADIQATVGARAGAGLPLTSHLGCVAFTDVEANILRTEVKLPNSDWMEPAIQVAVGLALTWAYPRVRW